MKVLRLILLVFNVSVLINTRGQETFLKHYSTQDGLPSAETYSVIQDNKGYIWVASDMGVCRFDGYQFKVYTSKDGLTDNTVFKFYQDKKNRLWFVTFSGKLCYFLNDSIYSSNIKVNDSIRSFIGTGLLTNITITGNDTLLVASSAGLMKVYPQFTGKNVSWDRFEVVSTKKTFLLNTGYLTLEADKHGASILTRYIDYKPAWQKTDLPYSGIIDIVGFSKNRMVILNNSFAEIFDSKGNKIWIDSTLSGCSFKQYDDSLFWIGRKSGGVHLRSIGDTTELKSFLAPYSVTGILEDRENGHWFTTLEDGLFYLPSAKFSYYIKPDRPFKIPECSIHNYGDSMVVLLLGKKIYKVVPTHGHVSLLPFLDKTSLTKANLWNCLVDSDRVFISSSSGIGMFEKTGKRLLKFINLHQDNTAKRDIDSRMMFKDKDGNFWSLNHSAIFKIDGKSKETIKTFIIRTRLETACISQLGSIMVGTSSGLYCIEGDSVVYLGGKCNLLKSRIVDIRNTGSKIIIATRGQGVLILQGDSIYQVNAEKGLSSDLCRSLCIYSNNIWVSTNTGLNLIRFNSSSSSPLISTFTLSDGLLSNDNEQVLHCGDNLFLFSQKGISVFNPEIATKNKVAPPVYINSIGVNDVLVSPENIHSFDYGTNFIVINFAGLTYKNAGKQLYKYRLIGYDTTINYTRNTFVQFTRLPPGKYQFVVSCINNSGIESESPAVFNFSIDAPFYMKWWFGFTLSTVAVFFIGLAAFVYVERVRKREIHKTEVNRKIANLELQALRAQMDPHFIFNCLNAIQDFITKNQPGQAKHYLNSFSKLVRETLDNSRKTETWLIEEIEFLNLYLELEKMRAAGKFSYQLTFDPVLASRQIAIPAMILQPFVENAIRHGTLGSLPRQGQLNINFALLDKQLICKIDDNGIGVNQSKKMKADSPETGKVHALKLIADRVRTINEINKTDIRYTISDKSDLRTDDTGTEVIVYIPLE